LLKSHPSLSQEAEIEIIPIRTNGDWRPEQKEKRFLELGGNKGLFTKEIEDALLNDHIDLAVHSMKDVASVETPGLVLGAILPREDARDAFISHLVPTLQELPAGAAVGTASLRRQAQILALRPDLKIVPLRGNVGTRLDKMSQGAIDATLLAVAGLNRLGLHSRISSILPVETILPAASQGALGVEIRCEDNFMRDLLKPLDDPQTRACITAERAVMRAIDGTCHTPAGAYAKLDGGTLTLEGLVAHADGSDMLRLSATGDAREADRIGEELGQALRKNSPAHIFAA
jgi:hydroxymethylbilane synthase